MFDAPLLDEDVDDDDDVVSASTNKTFARFSSSAAR
jgi:hypothetical protein